VKNHSVARSLFLPLALVVLSSLAGCGPSTVKVDGDVFIVTKSGESVKLALVEVRAVPAAEMARFLRAKIDATLLEIQARTAALEQARASYDEADQALQKVQKENAARTTKANSLAEMNAILESIIKEGRGKRATDELFSREKTLNRYRVSPSHLVVVE